MLNPLDIYINVLPNKEEIFFSWHRQEASNKKQTILYRSEQNTINNTEISKQLKIS